MGTQLQEFSDSLEEMPAEEKEQLVAAKRADLEKKAKINKAIISKAATRLREKTKSGAGSADGADSGGVAVDPQNLAYYQAVQNDIDALLHVYGKNFSALQPLPIAQDVDAQTGGVQEGHAVLQST